LENHVLEISPRGDVRVGRGDFFTLCFPAYSSDGTLVPLVGYSGNLSATMGDESGEVMISVDGVVDENELSDTYGYMTFTVESQDNQNEFVGVYDVEVYKNAQTMKLNFPLGFEVVGGIRR
jgi:hypothetical protein